MDNRGYIDKYLAETSEIIQKIDRTKIAEIIRERGQSKCVAIMLDGTRRVLKIKPGFHNDHRDEVLGLGRRVGDMWIHDSQK